MGDHTIATAAGNSGSPVYLAYQYYSGSEIQTVYAVIAVHKGGFTTNYNYGAIMTPYKIQFYKNNAYIAY